MDWLKRFMETFSPYREEYSVRGGGRTIAMVKNAASGEVAVTYNGVVYSRLPKGSVFTGSYWDFLLPMGCLQESPRVLMIGLGGGTVAYQMERLFKGRVRLDAVEIDRGMIGVARRFYPSMRANVVMADGADFVRGTKAKYDAMILDAYTDMEIPRRFLTREFCADAYRALKRDGVLAVNFAKTFSNARELDDYAALLSGLFSVHLIEVGGVSNNTILLCSKGLGKGAMLKALRERMPKGKEARAVLNGYRRMAAYGRPAQK